MNWDSPADLDTPAAGHPAWCLSQRSLLFRDPSSAHLGRLLPSATQVVRFTLHRHHSHRWPHKWGPKVAQRGVPPMVPSFTRPFQANEWPTSRWAGCFLSQAEAHTTTSFFPQISKISPFLHFHFLNVRTTGMKSASSCLVSPTHPLLVEIITVLHNINGALIVFTVLKVWHAASFFILTGISETINTRWNSGLESLRHAHVYS